MLKLNRHLRDLPNHLNPVNNLAKNNMFSIEVGTGSQSDKKLAPVGIPSAVGHAQQPGAGVSPLEVLICESRTVDRVPSGAVSVRDIAALDHKIVNYSVECGISVAELLRGGLEPYVSVLACAESSEVFGSFWGDVSEQLKDHSPG